MDQRKLVSSTTLPVLRNDKGRTGFCFMSTVLYVGNLVSIVDLGNHKWGKFTIQRLTMTEPGRRLHRVGVFA